MKATPLPASKTLSAGPQKRMALYARVSTQEQTRGQYPSCQSQIEELEAFCRAKGWQVQERVKDEGISAGSLNRRGLTYVRSLVESEQIDGVVCTWYDRMTRSRDFYTLDKEFKAHGVEFITLHDPTDRHTASGRFLETMLVAAKTYEREQTGEKVRTKMRMRAEKGMWNGGAVPFGFKRDPQSQVLMPDEDKVSIVRQLFQVYIETQSDFAVRDWLKARHIPAPGGKAVWAVGTLRDLLCNRRYIAEIEINKDNKERAEMPEFEVYRVVSAPHEALVTRETFELAQALRQQKAGLYPNNPGATRSHSGSKGRSYSWAKDARVYPLQGLLICSICQSLMSPHYVFHKAGKGRRKDSFINHYVCTRHRKYGKDCDHSNRVLARVPERWVLDRVSELAEMPGLLESAVESALLKSEVGLAPLREEMARVRAGLQETDKEIEGLMNALSVGTPSPTLIQMVNEKAGDLNGQREMLRADLRRLMSHTASMEHKPDVEALRGLLSDFATLAEQAEPIELQRLLRLLVRRVVWNPCGQHTIELYDLSGAKKEGSQKQKMPNPELLQEEKDRFDISIWNGWPGRTRTSDQSVNSRPLYH